jgi:5'(3')-deoxyribonucleotidase
MKTIAIDIDDVIADSTEALRQLVNERFGAELTAEHYQVPDDYWGYYERVWQTHGIADQVSLTALEDEMVIDQSRMPLLARASFAIGELSKKFHIVLITSRDPSWEPATKRWLREKFDSFAPELYFVRNHKEADSKTKGEVCKDLEVAWLIDDNVEHCKSALDQGVEAVLFGEYGWHHAAPAGLDRCKDWPAVLEYFDARG